MFGIRDKKDIKTIQDLEDVIGSLKEDILNNDMLLRYIIMNATITHDFSRSETKRFKEILYMSYKDCIESIINERGSVPTLDQITTKKTRKKTK